MTWSQGICEGSPVVCVRHCVSLWMIQWMCPLLAVSGGCALRNEERAAIRGSFESHGETPTLLLFNTAPQRSQSVSCLLTFGPRWGACITVWTDRLLPSLRKSRWTQKHTWGQPEQATCCACLVWAPNSLQPRNNVWTFTSSQPQLEQHCSMIDFLCYR